MNINQKIQFLKNRRHMDAMRIKRLKRHRDVLALVLKKALSKNPTNELLAVRARAEGLIEAINRLKQSGRLNEIFNRPDVSKGLNNIKAALIRSSFKNKLETDPNVISAARKLYELGKRENNRDIMHLADEIATEYVRMGKNVNTLQTRLKYIE